MIIASRIFDTPNGHLKLDFSAVTGSIPAFKFELHDATDKTLESFTAYGQDSVQALLQCLTTAGDTMQKFTQKLTGARCYRTDYR